jgi:hypothetical protein
MRYFLLAITTTAALSCHPKVKEDKQTAAQPPAIVKDTSSSISFFDSIAAKSALPVQQIKAHTTIDSFYYTELYSEATFEGDTIYRLHNGATGAIINYNDGRNCSKKLFLIFPAGATINSDFKTIETDCDRDYSGNYFYIHYKLLGDSGLETTEYYIPPNKEEDDDGKVWERIKYKISKSGQLDTLMIKTYHE